MPIDKRPNVCHNTLKAWLCACTLPFVLMGCDDQGMKQTLRGNQEENKVLREKIADLEARIETLKADRRESESSITERYRLKLADNEAKLATVRLELGAIQREKMALEDRVESGPRIDAGLRNRFMTERIVYVVLIGLSLVLAILLGLRWRRTNDRLQLLVLQEASDLRRIGERK